MTVPSRDEYAQWTTAHFDALADQLRGQIGRSRAWSTNHVESIKNPGGTEWTGTSNDAAVDLAEHAVRVTNARIGIAEDLIKIAQRGRDSVHAGMSKVDDAVDTAEQDGFQVSSDWVALPTGRWDPDKMVAANGHTEMIQYHLKSLVDTDAAIHGELTKKAAEFDGLKLPRPKGKGDTQPLDNKLKEGSGDKPSLISPFQKDSVEEGGGPGPADAAHNAQGIRGDEGVLINRGRILFGDTARLTPDGKLEYEGAPMYHYHLDPSGKPILDGPPVTGDALEQGVQPGHRLIPTGSTGPDGMPNGTNLMFGKEWKWSKDQTFPTDTQVYDTSGVGPFPKVTTLHGLRDVASMPYGNNQLLISGVTGSGADSVRQAWVTPAQSAPGNYDFLDQHTWKPVAGALPANIAPDGESTASLFNVKTPNGLEYGLLSTNPNNSAVEMRVAPTPDGLMSAPATTLAEGNGHYLYSPNVTQVVPQPAGGYRVDMTYSERFNPQPDPSKPGYVEPGNLGGQVYQNTFGHVTVTPPPAK